MESFNRGLLLLNALEDLIELVKRRNLAFRSDYTFDALIVSYKILNRIHDTIRGTDLSQIEYVGEAKRLNLDFDFDYQQC